MGTQSHSHGCTLSPRAPASRLRWRFGGLRLSPSKQLCVDGSRGRTGVLWAGIALMHTPEMTGTTI
jgi:hypothetical protein